MAIRGNVQCETCSQTISMQRCLHLKGSIRVGFSSNPVDADDEYLFCSWECLKAFTGDVNNKTYQYKSPGLKELPDAPEGSLVDLREMAPEEIGPDEVHMPDGSSLPAPQKARGLFVDRTGEEPPLLIPPGPPHTVKVPPGMEGDIPSGQAPAGIRLPDPRSPQRR